MEHVEQQVMDHRKEAVDNDDDALNCNVNTPPHRLHRGPECPRPHKREAAESLPDRSLHHAIECQELKKSEKSKGHQGTDSTKHKTSNKTKRQTIKPPQIKAPKPAKPKVQSFLTINVLELTSQVSELQLQLKRVITEKKQLERLLHRHTTALRHYRESEDGLSQILINHQNESRALKELLRDTRVCRDSLARQLQTAETKLMNTQSNLRRLQMLNQEQGLLEREELTQRLAKATAELEDKDKTIADLKKNLELCQASFNRQVVLEQKKSKEARQIANDLQEDKCHLTKEIRDRKKDLEKLYIYSQRFFKTSCKKGRGNKIINSDGLPHPLATEENILKTQYEKCDDENQRFRSLVLEGSVQGN